MEAEVIGQADVTFSRIDLDEAITLIERLESGDSNARATVVSAVAKEMQRQRIQRLMIVADLREVSDFFGVAYTTVKGWRMENPPMPGTPGAWNLTDIFHWRLARIEGRHRGD